MRKLLMVVSVVALGAVGCGGEEEEGAVPEVNCDAGVPIPTFSEVAVFEECSKCHSKLLTGNARMKAPTDINFDDYASAVAHARKATSEVNGGDMPPPDAPGFPEPTEQEKQQLYLWALCGTPQ